MARIYVASSWRNEQHVHVVSRLRGVGHQVFDYRDPPGGVGCFKWEQVGVDVSLPASQYIRTLTTDPRCALGYMVDKRGMEWADTCVLVLPSGRSAHLEAGWFAGQGKRLIIFTHDNEDPDLMQLMANHIVTSLEEVVNVLAKG